MGVAQFLVTKYGQNVVIKYIFTHFFIFAKMGSQKGAKNLFIDFFNFAWVDGCVDDREKMEMKDNWILHISIPIWVFKIVCKLV